MFLVSYNPESRLASLSVEVKTVWAIGFSFWILVLTSGMEQVLVFLLLLLLGFYGNIKISAILNYLRLFLPVFSIIFLLHLFYHSGEIIFQIWFLKATQSGLKAGVFNLARFINFIMLALCFFNWTSPEELAGKLSSGFGLARAKFFQELALVFFIAMRFLPVLSKERTTVKMAMNARGADFKKGFIHKIKMETKLTLPLFARVIRQSDDVAAAISLKGYNGVYFTGAKKSLKAMDLFLIGLAIGVTIILIIL